MLDCTAYAEAPSSTTTESFTHRAPAPVAATLVGLEDLLAGLPLRRRLLQPKQHVFRAGQPRTALHLVHAGVFKTSLVAEDGREKITGFRLRGDLLGLDSLDMPTYACDAVALDVGEVWELPVEALRERMPAFQAHLTSALAGEIRRDWAWMLAVSTLSAEQRVVAFLLDLASRMEALGFSPWQMTLRMTRSEVGNYLSLQLETVVRALSRLQAGGLIAIDGRAIRLQDLAGLRAVLAPPQALAA